MKKIRFWTHFSASTLAMIEGFCDNGKVFQFSSPLGMFFSSGYARQVENFPFWPRSYVIHTLIRLPKLIDSLDKYITEPRNLIGNWKELSTIGN